MINKLKKLFIRPSKFDQAIFANLQELQQRVSNLDAHIVTLARVALIKPDRFFKESQNLKANAEYLVSLVKAKEGR
jgi:hypothetical protein